MPNHCYNQLWIRGANDDIAKFKAHVGLDQPEPAFDFSTIIPYPQEWAERDSDMREVDKLSGEARRTALAKFAAKWGTDRDGFNSGGYEWRIGTWGTKWGAYSVGLTAWCGYTIVLFQTAWTPPRPIMLAIAEQFPTLNFELQYSEMGVGVGGFICVERDGDGSARIVEGDFEYRGGLGG